MPISKFDNLPKWRDAHISITEPYIYFSMDQLKNDKSKENNHKEDIQKGLNKVCLVLVGVFALGELANFGRRSNAFKPTDSAPSSLSCWRTLEYGSTPGGRTPMATSEEVISCRLSERPVTDSALSNVILESCLRRAVLGRLIRRVRMVTFPALSAMENRKLSFWK